MTEEKRALEALAQALAAKVKNGKRARPSLRVVATPRASQFDSITRDCILRRIRYLARAYRLQWLVDQEAFNEPNIDTLEDHALGRLLRKLETARECLQEGISFEDAGLVARVDSSLGADW